MGDKIIVQTSDAPPKKDVKISNAWMLIFADLLSLMLIFFILLYMVAQPAQDQWKELTRSLSERLNPSRSLVINPEVTVFDVTGRDRVDALPIDYVYRLLGNTLRWEPLLKEVQLEKTPNYVVMRLPDIMLFESGQITLSTEAENSIRKLGDLLMQFGNKVHVVGSSDPLPTRNLSHFKSNWEISMARALYVAQILRKSGYLHPLSVLATDHYDQGPLVGKRKEDPNTHRRLRRVDIIVYAEEAPRFNINN